MISAAVSGFGVSFSLILAIGAQNAFVLRQGLRGEHIFPICAFCAASDALLISIGVFGFRAVADRLPGVETALIIGGAAFLTWYGAVRLWAAFGPAHTLTPGDQPPQSLKTALETCAAFTWLNPHVYLDTLGLIGAYAARWPGAETAFTAGAVAASGVFFFSLGYGAAALRPWLASPRAWRMVDGVIGVVMLSLAASLALSF